MNQEPIIRVRDLRRDFAVGRRRPVQRGVWPWHARTGNALIVAWLRRRIAMQAHDIAPMRVSRRQDLLDVGVEDLRIEQWFPADDRTAAGCAALGGVPIADAR